VLLLGVLRWITRLIGEYAQARAACHSSATDRFRETLLAALLK